MVVVVVVVVVVLYSIHVVYSVLVMSQFCYQKLPTVTIILCAGVTKVAGRFQVLGSAVGVLLMEL